MTTMHKKPAQKVVKGSKTPRRPRYKATDIPKSVEKFRADYEEIQVALDTMSRAQTVQRQRVEPLLRQTSYFRDL